MLVPGGTDEIGPESLVCVGLAGEGERGGQFRLLALSVSEEGRKGRRQRGGKEGVHHPFGAVTGDCDPSAKDVGEQFRDKGHRIVDGWLQWWVGFGLGRNGDEGVLIRCHTGRVGRGSGCHILDQQQQVVRHSGQVSLSVSHW